MNDCLDHVGLLICLWGTVRTDVEKTPVHCGQHHSPGLGSGMCHPTGNYYLGYIYLKTQNIKYLLPLNRPSKNEQMNPKEIQKGLGEVPHGY